MSYQIADEPEATSLGNYVVQPHAPLLAMMMCGAWLAWPWFAFNSIAMGSPTRRREIALVVGAVVGTALLGWGVLAMIDLGWIDVGTQLYLAILVITTWKLGMAQYICTVQSRTFHVYEYYGGATRNAGTVIGIGYWLGDLVTGASSDLLWRIIVGGLP